MRLLAISVFLVIPFARDIIPQKNSPEYFLGIKEESKKLKQSDTLTFKIEWVDSLSLLLP